jgi:hypothetical protein
VVERRLLQGRRAAFWSRGTIIGMGPLALLNNFLGSSSSALVFKAGLDNNSGDFNNKNALQIFFLFLHHVRLSLVGVGKHKMTTLGHCKGKKHNYNKVAK